MGLLQAIELVEDRQTKVPATAATAMAMEAARDQGLLLGKGGMYGNVLRFSPPMNIGRADVDNFFGMLDKALTAVAAVAAGGAR
jgi:4-aminobutyrate aminotransferase-like enzyme